MAARKPAAGSLGRARMAGEAATTKPRAPLASDDGPPVHSVTAIAAEALRTGVFPGRRKPEALHQTITIRVGDPDDDPLANEYVGDETPGGSASTPDQSNVDEIGRAYGLQEEDAGDLRSASEVLARRDRKRAELSPPRRPRS